MKNTILPPLSLYIHLPWCLQKCPYCDFNSHPLYKALPEKAYLQALFSDLTMMLPKVENRPITSIFFGGGTPSLFSPDAIAQILEHVKATFTFDSSIEITLEANPGTFEQQKFADFRQAGINRLSIGIQSFQPEKLQILGRIHDTKQAIRSVEIAHHAEFEQINVDLMYGLSHQSVEDAQFDLTTACALTPTHLSWYQLTLEPNTLYATKPPPALPADEEVWQIQMAGLDQLAQAGFMQYEVSAHAKPNSECQHNINYWEFGDYVGIGAGAHSKITLEIEGKWIVERLVKVKHPRAYLAKPVVIAEQKIIPCSSLPFEFMLNACRLKKSLPLSLFRERTGLTNAAIEKPLLLATQKGFLTHHSDQITLTPLGWQFMNDLLQVFC